MTIGDERFQASVKSVAAETAERTATEKIKAAFTVEQRRESLGLNGPHCENCERHLNVFRKVLDTRMESSRMTTRTTIDQVVDAAFKGLGTDKNGDGGARQARRMHNRLNDQESCLKNVRGATNTHLSMFSTIDLFFCCS